MSTGDLEWVCGFGQGHREPDPVPVPVRAKSPEDPKQMQRKRTGPKQSALARRKLAQLVAVVWEMPAERERERERERASPPCSRQGAEVPD